MFYNLRKTRHFTKIYPFGFPIILKSLSFSSRNLKNQFRRFNEDHLNKSLFCCPQFYETLKVVFTVYQISFVNFVVSMINFNFSDAINSKVNIFCSTNKHAKKRKNENYSKLYPRWNLSGQRKKKKFPS